MMHAERKGRSIGTSRPLPKGSELMPGPTASEAIARGSNPMIVEIAHEKAKCPQTMILHSGFSVMAYRSFTEDVIGQVQRAKLNLGIHTNRILRLLPSVEEAMHRNDFKYEHSGLGAHHTCHMSVIARQGMLYRFAIIPPEDEEGTVPALHVDTSWIEKADPVRDGDYRASLDLHQSIELVHIHTFLKEVP